MYDAFRRSMTESLNMHKHLSNNLFYDFTDTSSQGEKQISSPCNFRILIQSTNVAQICGWCHYKVIKNEIYHSLYNRFRAGDEPLSDW